MTHSLLSRQSLRAYALGWLSAGAALIAIWVWEPPSTLTANLIGGAEAESAQFDARVRRRFSIGTPVFELAKQLVKEGFAPAWLDDGGSHNEYIAVRRSSDLACSFESRVLWRLNTERRISSIRGVRQMTCF